MNSSLLNSGNRATAMPTGAQGIMPRRSSYAAIVSGQASASSSAQQHPAFPQWHAESLWSHNDSIDDEDDDDDMDDFTNDPASTWRQWAAARQLPSYSRAFQPLVDSRGGPGSRYVENINIFFIPTYLRGSKYAKKLEDAHRAKAAAKKNRSRKASTTSTGVVDVLGKSASYNGVTLEVVEKAPPRNADDPEPLPSKMNVNDKHSNVEVIADGQEIKFSQHTPKDRAAQQESNAYAIRADTVVPQASGLYYFEVTVLTKNSDE